MNLDTANLGPRTVDEGVVVQELAAKHKRDGEETEQVSVGLGLVSEHRHPAGQVVHAEQDGSRGQPCGAKHLVYPFAERRGHHAAGRDES